ncbi:MAG: IS1595 family transposase [Gammaproteobacteria bacterium]|nr:IS1595 family transposase [Gammaproteobacteria bacterium]
MTTFYEFQEQFPDDEACLERLMHERFGGTEMDCPKCGKHAKFYRMTRERAYVCQHCKYQLHPTVGTFMERSRTLLHKWFYAMHLFSISRHGVAARELQRALGVTLKTAWRMGHEIRKYMNDVDDEFPLDGDVEADETYVGGKRSGKPGRGAIGKTIIFGMLQRGGDVMTKVVPNVRKRTLQPIIWENVKEGSTVHTDELRSYRGLDQAGYEHRTVNHGAGEYVRMGSHVNSLETFWSRLKNSIRGTHVHVSKQHLWMYMKEFEYRYNRREKPGAIFSDLVSGLGRLPLVTHQSDA